MNAANHFIVECTTNTFSSDGDHTCIRERLTTSDGGRAIVYYMDQCGKHERVELACYYVDASNHETLEIIKGGLS